MAQRSTITQAPNIIPSRIIWADERDSLDDGRMDKCADTGYVWKRARDFFCSYTNTVFFFGWVLCEKRLAK